MPFEPIAIIGQACLFPGSTTPEKLWRNSIEKKDCLSDAAKDRWMIDPLTILNKTKNPNPDLTPTIRGGYLTEFNQLFDPTGFQIPAEEIVSLDVVFQWTLYLAREAFAHTQYHYQHLSPYRIGAIFGNLSYPTQKLVETALTIWLKQQNNPALLALFSHPIDWRNRFMSGFPAQFLARALNLTGAVYTLDAACASSLYALKLACQELHAHRADLMLAGGINAIDEVFVLLGFSALHALSQTGQSKPFNSDADGLVPCQGGSLFLLKRLTDAIHDKDIILAVIRGIGLSNDGAEGGLLVPSITGQILAMQQAYSVAEINPTDISYIECHATGTPVGDGIEIHSMQKIFEENNHLVLGALKSNIGHALTASAGAALIRTICAMQENTLPPIRYLDQPIDELKNSNFRVLIQAEPWGKNNKSRYAAINAFGMGGTNAHLILQQWQTETLPFHFENKTGQKDKIAIIAMDSTVGNCHGLNEFTDHLLRNHSLLVPNDEFNTSSACMTEIELPITDMHFPPNDLKETLGQQLAILHTGLSAIKRIKQPLLERTGIFIGMGCDPEIARRCLRWFLPGLLNKYNITVSQQWLTQALDTISISCKSAHVIGAMPNIIASRLAIQWNCKGPCFVTCSEELSGISALNIAIDALRAKEIDMAVVGAVDMSCEMVHLLATKALLPAIKQTPSDAAIVFILKREEDAEHDHEEIYALLTDESLIAATPYLLDETSFTPLFGHAHAASGLLHTMAAALACAYQVLPTKNKHFPIPWVSPDKLYSAQVNIHTLGEQEKKIFLLAKKNNKPKPFILNKPPYLYCFSGKNRTEVIDALKNNVISTNGSTKLVILAENKEALQEKHEMALHLLINKKINISLPHNGIYFRDMPLEGKIAFVFSSSNTSYQDMGIDLALAFPEFLNKIQDRYTNLSLVINSIYGQLDTTKNFLTEILSAGYLGWLHCLLSREILNINPDMILGHSLGEFSALNAMDIIRDQNKLENDAVEYELFTRLLDGEYTALSKYYPELSKEQIDWQNWRIRADLNDVENALLGEKYCHLTMINSPHDFIISGLPPSCQRVIKKLNAKISQKINMSLMTHCPELMAVADKWRQLYFRPVHPTDVSCYSCVTGKPYALTSESIADHFLILGSSTVNFPHLIQNAWQDGARFFIEHGPQALCSQWTKEILGEEKDYVATNFDQPGRSSLMQAMHVIAQLLVCGVNVNYHDFNQRVHPYER